MEPNTANAIPTSRRNMIRAGTAAGIVAVGLPSAASAVSVDGAGAFVATGGFNAPTSVTATTSELVTRAINVSWGEVEGATVYQVKYRVNGSNDPYTVAGTTETTTFQVGALTAGTTYQFVVVASNGTSTSFDSAPATATPIRLAPGVPTSVNATGDNASLTVSWSAPTSGGLTDTYEVQYSTTNSEPWVFINNISSSTFETTFTGLTNGTTYYVQVRARNDAGVSAWSASVSATPVASTSAAVATPPAPQPPVIGATTTSTSVTIFTDSGTQYDAPGTQYPNNYADGFRYSYSTNAGSTWTDAGVDSSTTSFTVSGISGSSQEIRVRKVNGGTTATSLVTLTRKTPTYPTGQVYSLVNPSSIWGVRGITVVAVGGSGNRGGDDGGRTGGNGGKGGRVAGTFTLDADETLYIAVGTGGSAGATNISNGGGGTGGTNPLTGYAGGRGGNAGSSGNSGGGGGGGAATVLRKGTTGSVTAATATTILVAGGGGGGGGADNTAGNGGGAFRLTTTSGTTGQDGQSAGGSDGGGSGAGGGGASGGVRGGLSKVTSFFKDYYRGNGGSAGSNSVNGVTTTVDGEDTASFVNGANGSVSLDYLEASWSSTPNT